MNTICKIGTETTVNTGPFIARALLAAIRDALRERPCISVRLEGEDGRLIDVMVGPNTPVSAVYANGRADFDLGDDAHAQLTKIVDIWVASAIKDGVILLPQLGSEA